MPLPCLKVPNASWRSSLDQHHLIDLAVLESCGSVAGLERSHCRLVEDRNTPVARLSGSLDAIGDQDQNRLG
jgi:hypothetical protein